MKLLGKESVIRSQTVSHSSGGTSPSWAGCWTPPWTRWGLSCL